MEFQKSLNFAYKTCFCPKISKFWFLSEIVVHINANAKLKNTSKPEHSNARYDLLKIKSNKELHIPMQIALNNRKVQIGIHKICNVLLTDGQNEMRFSFLCFLIEREHFCQKLNIWFFWDKNHIFWSKSQISGIPSKHCFIPLTVNTTEMKCIFPKK